MGNILDEIVAFRDATGLSDHRVGMILASNGRLIERLSNNGRMWPETEAEIRKNLAAEIERRFSHVEKSGNAPASRQGEEA